MWSGGQSASIAGGMTLQAGVQRRRVSLHKSRAKQTEEMDMYCLLHGSNSVNMNTIGFSRRVYFYLRRQAPLMQKPTDLFAIN